VFKIDSLRKREK